MRLTPGNSPKIVAENLRRLQHDGDTFSHALKLALRCARRTPLVQPASLRILKRIKVVA
jgi:hypothetical protein